MLTEQIAEFGKCYPPTLLERAQTYEALEYDDLAAFDAYVIYTLCQKEISDEFVTDLEAHSPEGEDWKACPEDVTALMVQSLALLVRCLTRLGAIDDARVMWRELQELEASARRNAEPSQDLVDKSTSLQWQSILRGAEYNVYSVQRSLESSPSSKFGASRREIYPWSIYEPARNTPESLSELNEYISYIAPNLEAKITALSAFDISGNATDDISYQLGLFAKTDLEPGQEILSEKSILTAIRPLEDALCDACGQDLEGISFDEVRQCDGEDCDVTFCSQDCKGRAVKGYHRPNLEEVEDEESSETDQDLTGGVNSVTVTDKEHEDVEEDPNTTSSLAPTCGNQDLSLIGRPTNTTTPEWDLYFLLLTRTIAMSITQTTHPLALTETKYLWADFNPCPYVTFLTSKSTSTSAKDSSSPPTLPTAPRTLPFSLRHTIQLPLDFLTTLSLTSIHPSVTPYTRPWLNLFDPWILQTLYAKFRGVANATQSTFDGQPEIAAVHPGWCLANHSCAPNVRWDPTGVRRFCVRKGEEVVGLGRQKDEEEVWKGIKAGEEIFSHYTDVRLPVQERRERLREVLGGSCRCERCLTESSAGV